MRPWGCDVHHRGRTWRLTSVDNEYRWTYLGCSFADWVEDWDWYDPHMEWLMALGRVFQAASQRALSERKQPTWWDRWSWLVLFVMLEVYLAMIVWVGIRVL